MRKILLLSIFIFTVSVSGFGQETTLDLREKLELSDIDKITVNTNILEPKSQIFRLEITQPQVIAELLEELESVEVILPCDCYTLHSIEFYRGDELIASLGYNDNLTFVRDKNGDYTVSVGLKRILERGRE